MKVKREKSTNTKGHYVRNAELLPAVIEAKALGKVTDKLIRMIQMIAERYSRKSNFIGYSFREDMVSAAVANLCNNALKFNPERSPTPNPFSYYTTGIHNSFLQYMADEKRHRQIRDKLLINAGSNPSFNYVDDRGEETSPRTSDETEITDKDHHDNPDELKPVEKDELKPPMARHPKWEAREPGPVTIYKPSDYDVDPITGKVTIKKIVVELPIVKLETKTTHAYRKAKVSKAPKKKAKAKKAPAKHK